MKKIAVALKNKGNKIDHFGKCEYFIIYNYDDKTDKIDYDDVIFSSKDHDKNHEEWEKSAEAIKDCDIVICEKIGLVAKTEVNNMGIKVIESEGFIEDVLDDFINKQINKKNIIIS